jgi:hypothetical protein
MKKGNTISNKKKRKKVWGIYPKNIIVKDFFKKDDVW